MFCFINFIKLLADKKQVYQKLWVYKMAIKTLIT